MEDRWRTQAGMVLHALEASLGDAVVERAKHVANLDANVCKKIRDRKPRSKWFDEHAVLGFVRAAYLDELAALYIAVVKDTEYRDGALALQKLIERLDILSIRNSVAHPTHPFLESYWYRVAALATDPIIEILSLSRVHRAARKAITGTLEDIPDEWIQKSIWKLPNNLPDVFDHDITGLVGRHSERRAIKKHILNPRIPLLAVVAAGGIGKTALVLDTLHQLSRDPSTADAFDLMLFISAKQEVLTVDGIVTLSAPQTIAEIEDAIASACAAIQDVPESADSFAHLKMHYGGDRLLICIDNLETILRDAPAAFVQFHESLPPGWKLLVTSRIAIDGATCLPLSGLSNGDAMMLARIYAERRGLPALSQPQVEQIAQAASNNPLATRLIVDAFARGRDIPTASGYMRAKVGEFAFANLLEALPDKTLLVLESLRLSVVQSREQICSQTGLNPDEVAEAIGLLGRTSLIQRREGSDGETYQLSEAINDFLLVHPNAVKLRESLLERVRSLRNLNVEIHVDQEEYQITQYDWKFLPSDTPARLTAQLGLARRTLMRRRTEVERIIATKSELDEIKPLYGDHPAFCSYYARVLELLKDPNGALEYLRSAVEKSGRHLRYELQLARLLHDQNEFDRALAIYEDCRARGLDEPEHTDRDAARRIVTGYFLALLFGGRYERVMQETKNWKKHPNFRRFLGTFRASAIKRDAERGYFDEKVEALRRASMILNDVLYSEGYFRDGNGVARNIIEEVMHISTLPDFRDSEQYRGLLEFIEEHVEQLYAGRHLREKGQELVRVAAGLGIPDNPFRTSKWLSFCSPSPLYEAVERESAERLTAQGYKLVTIYSLPQSVNYKFAKDEGGEQYFIHRSAFRGDQETGWLSLGVGAYVAVRADEGAREEGQALRVIEARPI